MATNINYYDPQTISRVISIVQNMNPEKGIGNYVSHIMTENGIKVKLTNGTIRVSLEAVEDIDSAYIIEKYSDYMIKTFERED
jgi:hypothetical protein